MNDLDHLLEIDMIPDDDPDFLPLKEDFKNEAAEIIKHKMGFVKQQVTFEPDRSRTNINNFIEAWHNYLLGLYYEVVKIQPPTREVTSPDRSWSYEADVERKSSTRENMDIPNCKTLGKWLICGS